MRLPGLSLHPRNGKTQAEEESGAFCALFAPARLATVIAGLRQSFQSQIFVVVHTPLCHRSELPTNFPEPQWQVTAFTPRKVKLIEPGHIYVARPTITY